MTQGSGSVVVVGSMNADLVARVDRHPQPGETRLGTTLEVLPGGKGANQAVAAARLGASVTFVGAIGDDPFANTAISSLRASGVNLDLLATVPGPTGVAVITVDNQGENSIVVIPGANASVDDDVVARHAETISGADVVLLQGEIPRSGNERAATLCSGRLVLNLAPVVEIDPHLLQIADPLIVNEHEASAAAAALGLSNSRSDEDLVAALLDVGVRSISLTVGSQGAIIGNDAGIKHVAAPGVNVVDTTGAGDAFAGALAARLSAGDSLLDAARLAVRVASFSVTTLGAQPSFPISGEDLPEDEQ